MRDNAVILLACALPFVAYIAIILFLKQQRQKKFSMETRDQSTLKLEKLEMRFAYAAVGALGCFVLSLMAALPARHYQLSGRPMPIDALPLPLRLACGKGGFTSFRTQYWIALVCLGFSIVWFKGARTYWRLRKDLLLNSP